MPVPAGYTLDKPGKSKPTASTLRLPPGYALDSAPEPAPASPAAPSLADLTTNTIDPATNTGYGLYRMGSYDYQGGQVTKPEIQVPFNQVQSALATGYSLHPDEAPRYQRDTSHTGRVARATSLVKSFLDRATQPVPDTPLVGNQWQQALAALGNVEKLPFNVVNRTARGLAGLPSSLASTAAGIAHGDPAALESLNPATMGEQATRGVQQDTSSLGPVAALGNLGGDATTAYLTAKLGGKIPEAGAATVEGTVNSAQSLVRRMAGSGPGVARALVREATEDNRQIALRNAEKTSEAVDKQREAQAKADYDHRAELLKLRQQYDQTVRDANQKFATDRPAALKANADALRDYNQKVGKVIQDRRAALAADQARRTAAARTQVAGSQLIYGLNQLDRALRDRAGQMYDAIRAKTGGISLPGTDLAAAARSALSNIKGTSVTPTVFRDILSKYPEAEPEFVEYQGAQIPRGHPLYKALVDNGAVSSPSLSFADLQGYYSELGKELSKGTLLGDVYTATRDLQEAVGGMMQRIADQAGPGVGRQLTAARVFYRKYMDTFHEPTGPSASGSPVAQALLAKDPEVAVAKFTGKSGARGVADLRRYSDSLANLAQSVGRTKQETAAATAAAPRTLKSIASVPPAKTTAVPAGPSLPLPPVLPDEPVVPFREPKLTPPRTISTEDIQQRNLAGVHSRVSGLATRLLGWAAIWPAFRMLSELTRTGSASLRPFAVMPAAGAAGMTVETLLDYPPVMEFLTRATPRQIATIPPDLRGAMPEIVEAAKERGMKVSPILVTWAATVQRNRGRQPSTSQPAQQPVQQGAAQ